MTASSASPTVRLRRQALRHIAGIVAAVMATIASPPLAADPGSPVILVFGDSLSAEYGLRRGSGWVALLQDRLRKEGFPHRIVNASISGETTAGGLVRLGAVLKKHRPDLVILELGANDGLRGLPIAQTRNNLDAMVSAARDAGARTLMVGIRIPPNYGIDYTRQFDGLFTGLARQRQLSVVPFLLEGVADNPSLFQADALHPNEQAQPKMLANVWGVLFPSGLLAHRNGGEQAALR